MQRKLDDELPRWRAWKNWQPNIVRIQKWKLLNDAKRTLAGRILDLGGPDFDLYWKTHGESLAEHLLPVYNKLPLRFKGSTIDECRCMAKRLLSVFDTLITTQEAEIELLVYLVGDCVDGGKLNLIETLFGKCKRIMRVGSTLQTT